MVGRSEASRLRSERVRLMALRGEDDRTAVEARWEATRALVWRSVLSVPLNVPRFVEGVHRFGADAVVLDLEDSVPGHDKVCARRALDEGPRLAARSGADVIVRVNNTPELLADDIAASVCPEVSALMIPKVESAETVRTVESLILRQEQALGMTEGQTRLFISIESSFGVAAMDEILRSSGRIVAAEIGEEDLAAELAIEPTPEGREFWTVRQLLVLAARRAGVQASGVSGFADYSDLANFRERAIEAREMGFSGGGAIHPTQVAVLNEVFVPSKKAVEEARDVAQAWEEARGQAFGWHGRMIDEPVAKRAYAVLRRWDAVTARDAAKTSLGGAESGLDSARQST
jgi:citrate lyase subunit beta / citryl-CoA lyase